MKIIFFSFLMFLLLINVGLSQVPGTAQATNGTVANLTFYNMPANTYNVLSGSPYTSPEFIFGEILPWKGPWQKGYLLRYNTYNQKLEIFENNKIKTPTPELVQAFKIGDDIYKTGFKNVDKNTTSTYYQVIYERKVKLLRFVSTILEEVKAADDVKLGSQFTTYNFYYLVENENFTKFLLGKKSFLKIFGPQYVTKIEEFIKANKLALKEQPDYIEVLKYYETLIP